MKTKRGNVYKSGHENYNELDTMRHSAAHLMAAAVMELWPDTKFGIGPTTENGFYYDFELPVKITDEDFPAIEDKMRELQKKNLSFSHAVVPTSEAIEDAKRNNQPYKLELLEDLSATEKEVSMYSLGLFTDLCKGPHVGASGETGIIKLLSVAGAYWKGDEHNQMLTRIYGTSFPSQKELDEFIETQEKAKERDHRVIGKKLGLFVFSDLVGKGLPMLTAKGATIRRELERFIVDEELKRGYEHVVTPPLAKTDLYKTSGHYPYYKDTMYPVMKVDEEELILRPMTCPHHFMLYKSSPRSYKDLPLRFAELASQFRYEKSGELTGLMRVRMFCLADAHIIATVDQAKDEIKAVLDLIDFVDKTLGLVKGVDYRYRLSLGKRGDTKKYYKDDKAWDHAENVLRDVLKETNDGYFFEAENEAAFYGPKIDVQVKNVSGKEETAFTVQYDFVMPKRFEMRYTDHEGKDVEPIVIHRSSLGAFERTMAFLIEKYAGAFPTWLNPVQVRVLPIADRHMEYAKSVYNALKHAHIRAELDERSETLGAKIRKGQEDKVSYMLILGDKEVESHMVSTRARNGKAGGPVSVDEFVETIRKEIDEKVIT